MKTIFTLTILITLLSTSLIFANEYDHATVTCTISGDAQSISDRVCDLENKISLKFKMVSIKGKSKIVKTDYSKDNVFNKITNQELAQNLAKNMSIKKRVDKDIKIGSWYVGDLHPFYVNKQNRYTVKLGKLNNEMVSSLLEELGAYDGLDLSKSENFKRKNLTLKHETGDDAQKIQIHFPEENYDGLSYHIKFRCFSR